MPVPLRTIRLTLLIAGLALMLFAGCKSDNDAEEQKSSGAPPQAAQGAPGKALSTVALRSNFSVGKKPAVGSLAKADLREIEGLSSPWAIHAVELKKGQVYTVDLRVPGASEDEPADFSPYMIIGDIDPRGKTFEEMVEADPVDHLDEPGFGIEGLYLRNWIRARRSGWHAVIISAGGLNEAETAIVGGLFGPYELRVLPGKRPLSTRNDGMPPIR